MSTVNQIDLPDGRRLDVRVSGPDDGLPLVFHHGTPSAGIPLRSLERAAHARGLRIVSASRPGYGSSTRQPGRRVVEVIADTDAVLDAIGAERCLVAGWSGGGPHALACAAGVDRTAAALVIAGVAPYTSEGLDWLAGMGEDNIDEFGATIAGEPVLREYLDAQAAILEKVTPETIVPALRSLLPPVDQQVLTDEFGEDMVAATTEGLRLGVDGWLDDDLAFVAPWGFDLADITVPTAIWQGSEDLMVPSSHGRWLSSRMPAAVAHHELGEGHLSVMLGAMDRMLDELVAAAG